MKMTQEDKVLMFFILMIIGSIVCFSLFPPKHLQIKQYLILQDQRSYQVDNYWKVPNSSQDSNCIQTDIESDYIICGSYTIIKNK